MKLHPDIPMFHAYPSIHSLLKDPGNGWDPLQDTGLLTIDAENIIMPFGGDTPYDDPRVRDIPVILAARGINTCILSNATAADRVARAADQLSMPYIHKGMVVEDSEGVEQSLPSKMRPEIYQYAVDTVGFGKNGRQAGHVDDQAKNIWGMRKVKEFDRFFWVYPRGILKSHLGSLAFRTVELPLLVPALHILSHDDNV
jgi:hypothetical protein